MNPINRSSQQPPLPDEWFHLLVESVKDYAIFMLDPSGYIMTWNEGAQHIKGYRAGEIIGRHFSVFFPAQEVRRGKPDYELRVARDEGRFEEENWRLRKDGTRFWANVVITALFNPQGQHVGFAKVTRDLTERRQAEQERQQLLALERAARAEAEAAVERLAAVQRLTEAALAHPDVDDLLHELVRHIAELLLVDTVAVLLIDPAAPGTAVVRTALGLEDDVARGTTVPLDSGFIGRITSERRPLVLDEMAQASRFSSVLVEKGVQALMGVPLAVEGRLLGVLHVGTFNFRNFTNTDAQFLQIAADRMALALDHARLFAAERHAREQAEVTAATLRARDEFLSIAAHELKTPMTSLRAASQLVLRRLHRGGTLEPQHLLQSLNTIEGQVFRLSRLVDQLLDTTRLQSRPLDLDRTTVNLTALATYLVDEASQRAPSHRFELAAAADIEAEVDALRIEQVLTNLLENAVKFSPPESLIEVAVSQPDDVTVQLSVRDHGYGVPPEHRERVFERFFQAHAQSHRSGLGLGLYISREIVERHGGAIAAEYPEDGGMRFVVTLPREAIDAAPPVGEEGVA